MGLDPHTTAKHQLLTGYLQAWFPIIAAKYPALTYAEGFAGPNQYKGGECGSPTHALSQGLRPDVSCLGKVVRFVFVEKRKDRFDNLERTIAKLTQASAGSTKLVVRSVHGECERDLLPALGSVGAWEQPVFVNLDGFGADTPFAVVERIGSSPHTEVLVTMAPSFFRRFAKVEEVASGDRFFGDDDWRNVDLCSTPEEKSRFLIDKYRTVLKAAGFQWILHFEMRDEGGHELYLFFATQSELGLEKMKDSMWKIDASLGQRFRDPRNPDQLAFAIDSPDLSPLNVALIAQLRETGGRAQVAALRKFTILETMYRRPHATTVLTQLRDAGIVSVEPRRVAGSSWVTLND